MMHGHQNVKVAASL